LHGKGAQNYGNYFWLQRFRQKIVCACVKNQSLVVEQELEKQPGNQHTST